jgi:hypothetical protein
VPATKDERRRDHERDASRIDARPGPFQNRVPRGRTLVVGSPAHRDDRRATRHTLPGGEGQIELSSVGPARQARARSNCCGKEWASRPACACVRHDSVGQCRRSRRIRRPLRCRAPVIGGVEHGHRVLGEAEQDSPHVDHDEAFCASPLAGHDIHELRRAWTGCSP